MPMPRFHSEIHISHWWHNEGYLSTTTPVLLKNHSTLQADAHNLTSQSNGSAQCSKKSFQLKTISHNDYKNTSDWNSILSISDCGLNARSMLHTSYTGCDAWHASSQEWAYYSNSVTAVTVLTTSTPHTTVVQSSVTWEQLWHSTEINPHRLQITLTQKTVWSTLYKAQIKLRMPLCS